MIASILPDTDMSDSVKFGFQVWNTFMEKCLRTFDGIAITV